MPDIRIAGRVRRSRGFLSATFELHDPRQQVRIAPPADSPGRVHGLWEQTCFECFLAEYATPGYWEINLSPAGNWNIFRFDGYRRGMREEPAVDHLPVAVHREKAVLRVVCRIDLSTLGISRPWLRVALSAVIKSEIGAGYWALAHPCSRPDFHHHQGFVMTL